MKYQLVDSYQLHNAIKMLRKEILRSKPTDLTSSTSVRLSITSLSFKEEM